MRKSAKVLTILVSAAILIFSYLIMANAGPLFVDDFEDGSKPNMLGGDFGSWDKDPSDLTQSCKLSFFTEPNANICLRLEYDVDSPNPAYNGFWMFLQGIDISGYKNIHLLVRGDSKAGFTNKIKLELKNDKKEVGKYTLTGIKDSWQDFNIPLDSFQGLTNLTKMAEFVIVFDDITSTVKSGVIYIDDIYFN